MAQRPVCLSVGGSDSCGGAGIQADLRVFEALHVHGCSAITALTAQNPDSISHIQGSSLAQFEAELKAITAYYPVASLKTGMLYDDEHLNALVRLKQSHFKQTALVVDPVLIASSGKHLFSSGNTMQAYEKLIAQATIWTPNLQEAAFFLGHDIDDPVDAASALLLLFKKPVLLKGGHGNGDRLRDIFCDTDGSVDFLEHPKQQLNHAMAHGTGCRLASAIAAHLALGENLATAVTSAHQWLQENLRSRTFLQPEK